MAQTILTKQQKELLILLFKDKDVATNFYLTGGTALAEYYLHHRFSEDLDFFSSQEFDPMSIQIILKKIKKQLGIIKIDYQQSFNRNLFFLHFDKEIIKTEFTYFPFTQISKTKKVDDIQIDSLIDLAVNKAFTIYQNPRSRDFIDLYLILKSENLLFADLLLKARNKFDTYIDPLQLGQQLLQVTELKDYPRLIQKMSEKSWQDFWVKEAEKLKSQVIQ